MSCYANQNYLGLTESCSTIGSEFKSDNSRERSRRLEKDQSLKETELQVSHHHNPLYYACKKTSKPLANIDNSSAHFPESIGLPKPIGSLTNNRVNDRRTVMMHLSQAAENVDHNTITY